MTAPVVFAPLEAAPVGPLFRPYAAEKRASQQRPVALERPLANCHRTTPNPVMHLLSI
jgi:hypothetical protein